jgi:hypothetical protein
MKRRRLLQFIVGLTLIGGTTGLAAAYRQVEIVAPEAEQTIHDNLGRMRVEVTVAPSLERGHQLKLALDGEPLDREWRSSSIWLEGIDRGEHTLRAFVIDGSGKVVATSAPVTFYMWQASRLFPTRR